MADRLLFSKTGRAKYISHLDLMRTFQRAFARAKIAIKHTEGFHPHPFVSIALPLSVGYSSQCEILEFGLLEGTPYEAVPARLTAAMPEGIVIHQCYPAQRKLKELTYLNYIMNFEYSEGRPQESEPAMQELLRRDSLVIQKKSNKSKKGYTEVDLIPQRHPHPGRGGPGPEPGPQPGAHPRRLLSILSRPGSRFRHLPPAGGVGRGGEGVPLIFLVCPSGRPVGPPFFFVSFGGDDGAFPLKSLLPGGKVPQCAHWGG